MNEPLFPPPLPAGRERRASERRRPPEPRHCLVLAGPDGRCRRGALHDVSAGGLGVALREPLGVGEQIVLDLSELWGWPILLFSGRVAHATPLPSGGWLIGCAVGRVIGEEELGALLRAGAGAPAACP